MACGPNRSARWIKTFILYVIVVSGAVEAFSSDQCVDGTYKYNGRFCCLCPAGQHLVEHCTNNLQKGKCELCQVETYTSEPTFQMYCEPCRSCLHRHGGLEEEEPCTPARNRKCRCQQGHYCNSGTETCVLCQPCTQCDPESIKVPCTATNDTVCDAKTTGGGTSSNIIIGAVVPVVVAIILVVFLVIWCKKRIQPSITGRNANNEAMQPLTGYAELKMMDKDEVNLLPHLPDLADIIGWRDMHDIALSTNISPVTIESVRLDYPGDSREQTLQLLRHFNEMHSRETSQKLIEMLRHKGKNEKADRVQSLLARPASVAESA